MAFLRLCAAVLAGAVLAGCGVDAATAKRTERFFDAQARGDFAAATSLLEAGVDVNAKSDDGFAVLHLTVAMCEIELVRLLLDAGADVNAKSHGTTALMDAVACRGSRSDLVNVLLDAGADVNAKSGGTTALIMAARVGKIGMVNVLLDAGADVDAKNEDGETALMVTDSQIVADMLRRRGADS